LALASRPRAEREKTIPWLAFIRPKQTPAMYQKTRFLGSVDMCESFCLRLAGEMVLLLEQLQCCQEQGFACLLLSQHGVGDNPSGRPGTNNHHVEIQGSSVQPCSWPARS